MKKYLVIFPTRWEIPSFFLLSPHTPYSLRVTRRGEVYMWRCGMGRRAVEERIHQVLERFSPEEVILSGFCGALGDRMREGDFFLADKVCGEDEIIELNKETLKEIEDTLRKMGLPFHRGTLLTRGRFTISLKERENGISAVDMEGYWVGKACQERRIPLTVVKIISDIVERGGYPPGKIMKKFIRFLRKRKKHLDILGRLLERFFYTDAV